MQCSIIEYTVNSRINFIDVTDFQYQISINLFLKRSLRRINLDNI